MLVRIMILTASIAQPPRHSGRKTTLCPSSTGGLSSAARVGHRPQASSNSAYDPNIDAIQIDYRAAMITLSWSSTRTACMVDDVGSSAARELRLEELDLERAVSDYVRELPFVWVAVDDEPGPGSDRAYLERDAIAQVSNNDREPIDPRADDLARAVQPDRRDP
ncbi:MAG: hypothetical protein U5J98_06070 [Halobacteriales archaeon]|nr:hypothetical protein [Halobacteriales archaeon]